MSDPDRLYALAERLGTERGVFDVRPREVDDHLFSPLSAGGVLGADAGLTIFRKDHVVISQNDSNLAQGRGLID